MGQKSYYDLNEAYAKYCDKYKLPKQELKEAHKDAFGLDSALDYVQFNIAQKMIIVGSSSDSRLVSAVDYWKAQGISIDFIPYRIYLIGDEYYFEFFSKPYDTHEYENLVLVCSAVHVIIHALNDETIEKYLKPLNLDKSKLAKLNKLRVKAEMPPITIL